MLQSRLYIPTRRETPHDTESRGQSLLIRAGFIRQLPSGVRAYLPIGEMILQRLRGLMRKELQSTKSLKYHLP
ncbi:MAG TPA: proline--tRNA ligase, partial [bacterium]|nr:proline--tRNA ligase [bacterium]